MNKKQEIKKRIDLINKGETPPGYKKSFTKVLPKDWNEDKLETLCIKRTETAGNRELETLSISAGIGFVNQALKFGRELSGKQYKHYIIINKGDFAYNKGNSKKYPQGCVYLLEDREEAAVPNVFNTFKLKSNCINGYYKQLFQIGYLNQQLHKYINFGVRNDGLLNLYDSDFYNVLLPCPNLQEQEKIAKILSCCDKVIELKEQLTKHYYEKRNFIIGYFLKNIKSKNVVKLGDICEMFSGGTPSVENRQYYNNGTIPFIKSGEIENDRTEDYITEDGLKNSSAKLTEQGDLLIALYGANSGNVALSKISGAINQAILCIRSSFIDSYYLLILLKFNKNRIIQKYLQGGQGNLSAQIIKSLKFKIPTIEEQKKIVKIISNIDKEIELLHQELEQYKQLKKSLSQLLLTGIVRVNEV